MSRVGIVVSAFNAGNYVPAMVASIKAQTYQDFECIIVDDGSTDNTALAARVSIDSDRRFTLLRQANSGCCAGRNAGLHRLSPNVQLISVMDADDVWLPTALESLVNHLDGHPEAIGVHALGEFIDSSGRRLQPGTFSSFGRSRLTGETGRLRPLPLDAPTTFSSVFTASLIFPPGLVLMKREVYERLGGYDVRSIEGDWDLLMRASRLGDFRFLNEVVIEYRRHESNVGASASMAAACAATRARAYYCSDNTPHQRTIARNCWRAIQKDLLAHHRESLVAALMHHDLRSAAHHAPRLFVAFVRFCRGGPARRAATYPPRVRH